MVLQGHNAHAHGDLATFTTSPTLRVVAHALFFLENGLLLTSNKNPENRNGMRGVQHDWCETPSPCVEILESDRHIAHNRPFTFANILRNFIPRPTASCGRAFIWCCKDTTHLPTETLQPLQPHQHSR
jgi:hypothetical protein